MKFKDIIKQILQEKWYDSFKRGQSSVEIFVNPNPVEIKNVVTNTDFKLKKWTKVRGFINLKNDDIYIWKPANILHEWVIKHLPITRKMSMEFNYMPNAKEIYISDSFNKRLNFEEIDWYFYGKLLKKSFDVKRIRLGEHIKTTLGLRPGDKFLTW